MTRTTKKHTVSVSSRNVEAVKFLWKQKHFEGGSGSELGSIRLFEEPEAKHFS